MYLVYIYEHCRFCYDNIHCECFHYTIIGYFGKANVLLSQNNNN